MQKLKGKKFIFIGGVSRSGTTVSHDNLAAHNDRYLEAYSKEDLDKCKKTINRS